MSHANPYTGYFPAPILPDLRLLDAIGRCSGCGGWSFRHRCSTCEVHRG